MDSLSLEKIPPQNIEAEMAVLGAMLIEEDAISYAVELLDKAFFYKDAHKKIFEAIVNLYNTNKAVDIITVSDELKRLNLLDDVGGVSFLSELVNSVPTAANIAHYARIVKERSISRSLINSGTQIVKLGYESEEEVDEVLDKAERLIFDIRQNKKESSTVALKEIVKDSIETLDKLYQKKNYVTGVPTGFVDFDLKTSGLQYSDFVVIAGRPSMGKSAFAITIAEHAGVVEKLPVVFFSLEMSKEQFVQRMLCSHARVDAHKVRTGYISASDWPRLTAAAGKLSEAPIFIEDAPAISAMELRAKARRLKAHNNIQLIVVDYMQLMRSSIRAENRQQEISEISRSLKALARVAYSGSSYKSAIQGGRITG
jgi:replicative DNA helicase